MTLLALQTRTLSPVYTTDLHNTLAINLHRVVSWLVGKLRSSQYYYYVCWDTVGTLLNSC